MSTLLYSLGRWSYRHSWRVLVSWLLLLGVVGGAVGVGVATGAVKGFDNSFSIPGTEGQEGLELLNRTFPQASGTSAQYIVVAAAGDRVDEKPYSDEIASAVSELGSLDGVLAVTDPFSENVDGMVSGDGQAALIRLQFQGTATDVPAATKTTLEDLSTSLDAALPAGSTVVVGGDLFSTSLPALSIIEAIGVLIALFVLIVTFRSLAVAWFPLVSALIGVGLSVVLIFASTAFATVSSTTPMLAIMLGLAVGIDYALFIVARHQDQVRAGVDPEESAARATGTAGSAVMFAGITVLIALVGLGFAGIPFLTTMGLAAAGAVAVAVVVAITLTPALLGFAKGRVVGWSRVLGRGIRVGRRRRPARAQADAAGAAPVTKTNPWVALVTRHPVVSTLAVILTLGVIAIPASSLQLALPNAGMQPTSSEARQAYDLTAEHFGPGANGPLILTGTIVTSTDPLTLMADLKADVEKIPGVERVALSTPNETADTGLVQIVPTTAPDAPQTAELVRELRAHHDEWLQKYGIDLKVTGFTAIAIDISDRLGAALLPFGLFVVGLSFVLLMIVFRSIWVPLKATLGYLLSILAAFGAVAAVFEWGWLADALHVTRTGPVISFMPIILMGVLFGLAMDYEVFLVSRMREDFVHARRDRGGRADRAMAVDAVRSGFTASARVVTAAAVIMFAVFAAFIPEGDTSIKPIALGLAVGIAVDAFLVRMTLGPAIMTLLGDKAWWMPRWLDRVLPHFDIEGAAVERELALTAWPEPGYDGALAADDLTVRVDGGAGVGEVMLFRASTIRLEQGGTLLATAADPRAGRAFVLAVAGRVDPSEGRLRVAGHLLPGRGAWVRAHVGVALLDGAAAPLTELRRALAGGTTIVAIDGLDTLTGADRDQAAALLRDAQERAAARISRGGAHARPLTLIASARREGPALDVLADAHRRSVTALSLTTGTADSPTQVISA
ncbi:MULTISPECIES: MMPL family transporter [Microbacterium]|uniref:Transporter n=1 Tax=Microbacterium hominis TaxID=162426 RepID=A0A2K9DS68_9MICO|nr:MULTISPECIES: MMPL family transporter [Microbacterium]AUG28694.1 transporter [Microbacterium hominis]